MNWILIQFQVLATWMSLHATTAYICINYGLWYDGNDDCGDNSDEAGYSKLLLILQRRTVFCFVFQN